MSTTRKREDEQVIGAKLAEQLVTHLRRMGASHMRWRTKVDDIPYWVEVGEGLAPDRDDGKPKLHLSVEEMELMEKVADAPGGVLRFGDGGVISEVQGLRRLASRGLVLYPGDGGWVLTEQGKWAVETFKATGGRDGAEETVRGPGSLHGEPDQ